MKYLKNQDTGKIISGENFGAFFDDWTELTQSEIDAYELDNAKIEKIAQCKSELAKTDWQGVAYLKRNRPIDAGICEHETMVANLIDQITACTTLEELNAINTDF